MRGENFYIPSISFFVGVAATSLCQGLALGGVVVAYLTALSGYLGAAKGRWALCAMAASIFLAGVLRMEISESGSHPLDHSLGRHIEIVGEVCEAPQQKETTSRLCFKPDGIGDGILLVVDRYPEYRYGDRLAVAGKLELPKNFASYDGGPEFDYISYLAKEGMRYVMFQPHADKIGEGGSRIKATLISWKTSFVQRIESLFTEPESSLLAGILIGEKGSLPKEVTEDFKASGLQHILVLSGYNVTIVAESLMRMFASLPKRVGRYLGAVSIVFFALFTGASATTIRASIMALIVLLSHSTARPYDISRALVLAAFLMVVHNPMILMFDVSFELSFLATLGLIYAAPLVRDRLGWVSERMNTREILSSSIGTQIMVVPFLMYKMGSISLISLVSNIFVLPLIPFSMLSGFIAVATSVFSKTLASPVAWIAQAPLSYILFIADISAKVPFAYVNKTMSAFALIVSYAVIIWLLSIAWRKKGSSPPSPN